MCWYGPNHRLLIVIRIDIVELFVLPMFQKHR